MPGSSRTVWFATGNSGKMEEANVILAPFGIRPRPLAGKGIEIQADSVSRVAEFSARRASRKYGKALIVEDAGLFVDALEGFPGAYSSHAFKTLGIAGLLRLLDGSRSRKASFKSAVAYCEPFGRPLVFEGRVEGRIANSPAGGSGFGFDPVFVAEGMRRSFGQISLEEKCNVSHRAGAMRKFASWYLRLKL